MNIICIGDVHGATNQYQKMIRQKFQERRTVALGDMGIGFSGVGLHQMDPRHGWFRGNHDDPAKCRETHNYMGDWGRIVEYDGTGAAGMFIGGGFSIDREWRVPGKTWWPDEELSYKEFGLVMADYCTLKPDFVLSHECPARAGRAMLDMLMGPYFAAKQECTHSRTAEAMQQMLEFHQPKEWVFGHYHVDRTFLIADCETKFTCVAPMSVYELIV